MRANLAHKHHSKSCVWLTGSKGGRRPVPRPFASHMEGIHARRSADGMWRAGQKFCRAVHGDICRVYLRARLAVLPGRFHSSLARVQACLPVLRLLQVT